MITGDRGDYRIVRFLPRHWKKRTSCRRCRKRRPHSHHVPTTRGLMKMLGKVYTAPILEALNAPNTLLRHLTLKGPGFLVTTEPT